MFRRLWRFGALLPDYARTAWYGLASPLSEKDTLVVVQAVVRSSAGVLLSVRSDLRGWELPGGNVDSGETETEALSREVAEETGVEVEVEYLIGEYVRTGFRPHRARVYACRPTGGEPRPSEETLVVRWFAEAALPETLFAWYRQPIRDALAGRREVMRQEHQGVGAIWSAMAIDLRMRWSGDRAGPPR